MPENFDEEEGLFTSTFLDLGGLVIETGRPVSKEDVEKQATEHACRMADPDDFDTFRRAECQQRSDGKCIDVIFGIKTRPRRRSTIQALRYPPKVWTAAAARTHCRGRGGSFTAGRKE